MLKDLNIHIPEIKERKQIPRDAIRSVVNHIAQTFDPEKIILFGSYAYGKPKRWSDVDLLVVIETDSPKQKQIEFPRTHDLLELQSYCQKQDATFATILPQMGLLNNYSVHIRYPGRFTGLEEAQGAVEAMNTVRDFIRSKVGL